LYTEEITANTKGDNSLYTEEITANTKGDNPGNKEWQCVFGEMRGVTVHRG